MKLYSGIIELKPGWFVKLPHPMTFMELGRYRFDPVTLMIIGIGVGATGGVMSAQAASAQGKSEQAMSEYNAKVQKMQAKQIEVKAEYDQQMQHEEAKRRMSSLRVGVGASGAVSTEGSPLLIEAKQASELELENLMIGYEGRIGNQAALNQAEMDIMQGKLSRQKGRNLATAGYTGAGRTLLTGLGTMGYLKQNPNNMFGTKIMKNQGIPGRTYA